MDLDGIADAVETIEEESARVGLLYSYMNFADDTEHSSDIPPDFPSQEP